MNILIICGSLEPGRDGVGDYVRMLGEELSRNTGCRISAMAIYDPWVVTETTGDQDQPFPVLRIPAAWSARRRLRCALAYTRKYRPDWISIQFVPYAFHPKGLPVYLAGHLEALTADTRVHLMVHEAWTGYGPGLHPKRMMTSGLQRILIRRMLDRLKPDVLHTHLPEFREKLERLRHPARELPLFSNIRVAAAPEQLPGRLILGFFSQVACSASILNFLDAMARKAVSAGLAAEILLIGGNEPRNKAFTRFIRTMPYYRNRVTSTGFLPATAISAAIGRCTLGITPVPRHALGKSGSVAAFLAHGVPVAAPHVLPGRTTSIGFFSAELQAAILTEPDLDRLAEVRGLLKSVVSGIQVPAISRRFLEDLNQHSPNSLI